MSALSGRYAGLPTYADTINGREVSVVELPDCPDPGNLFRDYEIVEGVVEGTEWDLLAAQRGMSESSWWLLYALNHLEAPDPLNIPPLSELVLPEASAAEVRAGGDEETEL